ncbi:MAG: primosomal replication protein N [Mesosutterella sp.]|nr:primosomal replication protein N [Mesosutterella sp.]
MNTLVLDGTIVKREEARYTPSGLQVFEGVLRHEGEVREAGGIRKLEFECMVVAFGETASRLQCLELPARVVLKGYISPRSRRTQRLLVYITDFN